MRCVRWFMIFTACTCLAIDGVAWSASLFSRKANAAAGANANAGDPRNMDCSQLASMPNAPMTLQQCESMKSMAMGAQGAMNDPSTARPGDAQMSCADIQAEMSTLDVSGVSQQHRVEGQQAGAALQSQLTKNRAEANRFGIQANAEMAAARAADTATEVSSAGLVRGHAADAAQKQIDAQSRALGEKQMRDTAPKSQATAGSIINSGNDLTQQMQSNPRFARLMKLAMEKNCH